MNEILKNGISSHERNQLMEIMFVPLSLGGKKKLFALFSPSHRLSKRDDKQQEQQVGFDIYLYKFELSRISYH